MRESACQASVRQSQTDTVLFYFISLDFVTSRLLNQSMFCVCCFCDSKYIYFYFFIFLSKSSWEPDIIEDGPILARGPPVADPYYW